MDVYNRPVTYRILPNNLFFEDIYQILQTGKSVSIRVRGVSMNPFLRDELDCVTISRCDATKLKKGDVVLFLFKDHHLLHRIIDVKDDRYIIRGDGCFAACEWADTSHVLGIVTQVIRPSGKSISTQSFGWRFRSSLWYHLGAFPRKVCLKIWHLFRKG